MTVDRQLALFGEPAGYHRETAAGIRPGERERGHYNVAGGHGGIRLSDWVVISTVQGQFEEGQLRAFLGAYDIPTQVRGEALRTTHGLSVDGLGAVAILVQATDAAAARDLLAKAERGELAVPDGDRGAHGGDSRLTRALARRRR